jgi:hypothetical protein
VSRSQKNGVNSLASPNTCQRCGREIGPLGTSWLWNNYTLCRTCYQLLAGPTDPPTAALAAHTARAVPGLLDSPTALPSIAPGADDSQSPPRVCRGCSRLVPADQVRFIAADPYCPQCHAAALGQPAPQDDTDPISPAEPATLPTAILDDSPDANSPIRPPITDPATPLDIETAQPPKLAPRFDPQALRRREIIRRAIRIGVPVAIALAIILLVFVIVALTR